MLFRAIDAANAVLKGNKARDEGDWHVARNAFGRAVELFPSLTPIWVQYGHALKEGSDWQGAETAYRRALALKPSKADTHLQLGHLLKIMGRLEEAELEYQIATECDPALADARTEFARLSEKRKGLSAGVANSLSHLRYVIIGTTGLCNASCASCPTGKPETDHVPRTPMSMALFEKLIRSIAELGIVVTDQISFGLFGDSLVDPFVVQRAQMLRKLLPDTRLDINTNGAAYNPKRHAILNDLCTYLSLHCESLDPDVYGELMAPLRAKNVFPKHDQILRDFPEKVLVSVPVSKLNLEELPAIRKHFLKLGARAVCSDPLSGRCAEDQTRFRELALDPHPIRCPSEILQDLIVDSDGKVLVCCQDFQRLEPIGDLARESLVEVMTNMERRRVRDIFDQGRHTEMTTCNRCYADLRGKPHLEVAIRDMPPAEAVPAE